MLRFAIVGCGRIAKRHSELLGFDKIKNASLVSVCDINENKARKIGQQFNIPHYINMDEMMEKESIDVVSVLTESGNHAKHVINLSKYGKHLIVEKPIALKLSDADLMIKACEKNDCKLFVVKQNRFNLPVVKLKQAHEEGRFGKLVLGTVRVRWSRYQSYYDQDSWRGTWALDGGVLANQASHHIDMLQWLMGDVESVFAKANTSLVDIEGEDTAVVTLKFKNGALGIIEATTATRPNDLEGSISILGEKGSVVISGFSVNKMESWAFVDRQKEDDDVLTKYSVNPPNVYGFGHQAYYEHVVDSIINNKKQLIDGISGKKSLELITAIYQSIETKKEVFLGLETIQSKLGKN
ncbi:Gfo/Idh/MocA family protein [Candidatus Pelagibacter bacterium nBUS_28]|uniref:Gfo/Idh/MocA family protein n=1 Tax=Candidatus Pelagibacter bacterium nBUS_28 TaxID=3374189 RepID=UPI003EB92333